ncbi:ABC transporter [Colletotrichum scovillei]|uniref:ABC transporter n=1 Tax=Colletotrichum scovillei TaxID=1209932 RepID=UPI0015C2C492|nr:ABC transporter [Colletotrichum scovillei]KAF4774111.1 ABC transporter [Colletotrichum scovillei]
MIYENLVNALTRVTPLLGWGQSCMLVPTASPNANFVGFLPRNSIISGGPIGLKRNGWIVVDAESGGSRGAAFEATWSWTLIGSRTVGSGAAFEATWSWTLIGSRCSCAVACPTAIAPTSAGSLGAALDVGSIGGTSAVNPSPRYLPKPIASTKVLPKSLLQLPRRIEAISSILGVIMSCPGIMGDRSFGPRVNHQCRSFDFTLFFEDAALTALVAFQVVFLALRTRYSSFKTTASISADVTAVASTIAVFALSALTHRRSQRPSTLVVLYLSVSSILGVARLRTLWLLSNELAVPTIFTCILFLSLVALVLESVAVTKQQTESEPLNNDKYVTPEQNSGFWARTCFWWLARTFRLGYTKVISLSDLPGLGPSIQSHRLHTELTASLDNYNHQHRHSLLRASLRSYFVPFLSPILPRLCLTVFTFAQPFLINTTVAYVARTSPDANYGRGLIGAWALVYLGIAVSTSVYQYHNFRFATRLRGGLIALLYRHAVHTREVDSGEITAVTLMGTDVERIFGAMSMFHSVWASLLEIAIASWLLGRQLSVACLAPILLVLVFIAATSRISVATKTAQMRWIERIQQRLRVTTVILGDMKAVKMLGFGRVMTGVLQRLRVDEVETSKSFRKLLVTTLLLSLTPINLAPIVTFTIYVIVSVFWKHATLLPAQAFTSIALIALLTTPVVEFIQLLPMVVQSIGCFSRIQDFCNYTHEPGLSDESTGDSPSSEHSQEPAFGLESLARTDSPLLTQKHIVSWENQYFGWGKDQAVLDGITVDVPRGMLTVVVGPVGSGKSSFLSALIGELKSRSSNRTTEHPEDNERCAMAYCSQSPWLENGTLRQNILGISIFEQKWYDSVVSACGLEADLQALEKGDLTVIGSNGVNLSGGQKQRVALARAVYSRCKVVVLDDVFSGIDAHTSCTATTRLLGLNGLFRQHHVTAVIATHDRNIMQFADNMVAIESGRIQEVGSPMTLASQKGYVSKLGFKASQYDNAIEEAEMSGSSRSPMEIEVSPANPHAEAPHGNTDVRRKNGEKAVYLYYLRNAGRKAVVMYTVSVVAWIFFSEFATIWIKWWSDSNTSAPNTSIGYYLGIYVTIGILGTVGASLAAWFAFLDVVPNTALGLHNDLLQTVFAASFRFLSKTDSGELLNRFSEDMQLVDMDLPATMVNYTSTAISVLAKVVILAVFSQYLGITLPFLAIVLFFLQQFYLQTSRQICLLGIEAKAPLYTHFSESVAGGPTIRAFRWQSEYQERNYGYIDTFQRPNYVQSCIQAWLTFVLNLLVAALAVMLVSTVVTWHDKFSASSVGVSLIMVIGFSEVLARLIQTWTKLESSIGAVARVRRFVSETETETSVGKTSLSSEWPPSGAISFSDVSASYSPGDGLVLKGVTLTIEAGQHIAICGRSGSGKTSLVLSLLQMMHVTKGIIKLDSVDLATVVPNDLRSRINVVTQDPFLVPGTVRFNIDPFGVVSNDGEIPRALEKVGLWGIVSRQGGLDKEMDSSAWSAGQKQLLCLARAIVRKSRVLILDEVMSSVDAATESVMQNVVDTEFAGCTVLAVMHRLGHVGQYDKVALLGDGEVLEFGDPQELISGNTQFSELYRMGGN